MQHEFEKDFQVRYRAWTLIVDPLCEPTNYCMSLRALTIILPSIYSY